MLQRGELADIIAGSVFLFIGLATCSIAAIRRKSGVRIFVWLGIWSAMYGAMHLSQSVAIVSLLPRWLQISAPYANTATTYLILVVGSLSFMELSIGKLRFLIQTVVLVALGIAVGGFAIFVFTGSNDKLIPYNSLLAACLLLILATVVAVPRLSSKYLDLPDRGVLAVGIFIFAIEALYTNVANPLGFETSRILDHLGFAILLFSLGYVALQLVFANERRLLAIEDELAIAREIQASILPSGVPELSRMRISAAYCPMTAVAGDFYWFIATDPNRAGFLVADVSGHGVPAALIASMIKVAMQSVVPCANDPQLVLRGVERALSGQQRGQFVSAAYLWLDTESHKALYSAAGHPPLLRWSQGKLESIQSNGLIFGVVPDCDYPVREISIATGDRFLLYTDGLTEPESIHGESFGDRRLEEVVRESQSRPSSELSDRLLSELRQWQPAREAQQDDITLIVIDVL